MEFTSVNAHIQCLHRTSLCNEQFLLVRSMAGRPGFDPLQGKRTFLLAYASIQSPIEMVPGVVTLGVKGGRGVILTIHLNVVSRSRMNMATPLSDECLHGVQRNSSYFQTFATTTTTATYRQSWILWRIFCHLLKTFSTYVNDSLSKGRPVARKYMFLIRQISGSPSNSRECRVKCVQKMRDT